jgi:salicylate 5-hydroxylase large subunit
MDTASSVFPQKIHWETGGTSRIPFMAYTEADQHRKELERLFYRKHWCYVGLEAEIPNPGDFTRTVIGERSVIMVRDNDGCIHVVENVCAHRGMQFCRERHGNRNELEPLQAMLKATFNARAAYIKAARDDVGVG